MIPEIHTHQKYKGSFARNGIVSGEKIHLYLHILAGLLVMYSPFTTRHFVWKIRQGIIVLLNSFIFFVKNVQVYSFFFGLFTIFFSKYLFLISCFGFFQCFFSRRDLHLPLTFIAYLYVNWSKKSNISQQNKKTNLLFSIQNERISNCVFWLDIECRRRNGAQSWQYSFWRKKFCKLPKWLK